MTANASMPPTWRLCIGLYALLLLTVLVGALTGRDENSPSLIFTLSVGLIPLLTVVRGVIRNDRKTWIWLCFILMFYFTIGVERAMIFWPTDVPSLLIAVWSTLLFIFALVHLKVTRVSTPT